MLKPILKKVAAIALIAAMPTWAFSQGADPFSVANLNKAPTTAWITNNGNLKGQRYVPLTQINKGNVAQMKANWRVHMDGSGLGANVSNQGTALFYDGLLYQVTGMDDIFAIDVETGNVAWKYIPQVPQAEVSVCCGWNARGLGIGDGKIYLGRNDGKIEALDIKTGKLVWSIQAVNNEDGYSITAAPLYYKDMVILGYAGGEYGIRGKMEAFSSKDGSKLWTFWLIPGPGEVGHDTWPQDNNFWQFGGASVWSTPVIDSETGTLYVGTGNPGPDLNGAARAGDNLFSASIVALDVDTGKYKCHFQEVHHDIWDYDGPNPIILFDYMIDGRMRKGLSHANKNGMNYLLDRTTCQPLLPDGIPETPVPQMASQLTAATQPIPRGDTLVPTYIDVAPEGFVLINQGRVYTPFGPSTALEDRVIYKPSAGINWPPPAYDPTTNIAYYCGNDRIGGGRQGAAAVKEPTITANGTRGGWSEGSFTSAPADDRALWTALSLSTNKIVWQQQNVARCHQGGLIAGDIFFSGRNDGRLIAQDKSNGMVLWSFQTDSGVNGSPISFEWKGVQYVSVMAAGTAFGDGSIKGDSVWLFSLNGTMDPIRPAAAGGGRGGAGAAPAGAPPAGAAPAAGGRGGAAAPAGGAPPAGGGRGAAAPAAAPAGEVSPPPGRVANLATGFALYDQRCRSCHGDTAESGEGGPAIPKVSTVNFIMTTATNGRPGTGMPAFRTELTQNEIHDIAAYIHDTLLPKHP